MARAVLPPDVKPRRTRSNISTSTAANSAPSMPAFLRDDEAPSDHTTWGFKDDDVYYGTIKSMVVEARHYIDNSVEPEVRRGYRYYNGGSDVPKMKGRSGITMTEVRDTIDRALPQILNIFMTNPNVVECQPTSDFSAEYARLQDRYCNYVFYKRNDGANLLHDFVKDALQAKRGVYKHYVTTENKLTDSAQYEGLTPDERDEVANRPGATIVHEHIRNLEKGQSVPFKSGDDVGTDVPIDHNKPTDPGQIAARMAAAHSILATSDEDTPWRHDMRVNYTQQKRKIVIEVIPPEEFIIDGQARSTMDASLIGHDRMLPRSKLVEMGFPAHEVAQCTPEHMKEPSAEAQLSRHERMRHIRGKDTFNNGEGAKYADPAQEIVRYLELYVRLDRDGDGISELRKVVLAGANFLVLYDEPAEYNPFTVASAIRIQHTAIGDSLADITMDLQDINTAMFRSIIDNANFANVPRLAYVENQVEASDLQNIHPGATIRMRQQGAIQPVTIPFTAANSMSIMEFLEQRKESRTGISAQSAGLDADALQSSTEVGVRAIVGSSQLMVQLMARMLAENGLKPLFRAIASLAKKYMPEELLKFGQHDPEHVNPALFDPDTDMTVNVGLGTGSLEMRMQALSQTLQSQNAILMSMSQLGVTPDVNPLVNLDDLRNTLVDLLELSGLRDGSRYYQPNAAATMKQVMQGIQHAKSQQPNPQMQELQIKQQTAQLDAQVMQQQAQQDLQHKQQAHEQKMQQDAEKHALQMRLQQGKVQADIGQHNAVTAASINNDQQKTEATIDNATVKTQADVELARYKAEHAPAPQQQGNNGDDK
jgi:hypothetical protein